MPEADGNRHSVRDVAPYGLVLVQGSWVLIAQCDLRKELRQFRLSRMNDLTILKDRFTFPVDFNLHNHRPAEDRHVLVRIQAHKDIADKIMGASNYFMESFEDHEDSLYVTFRVRQPEELLQWVLGWGANVVVLEPESLRDRVREETEKVFKRY